MLLLGAACWTRTNNFEILSLAPLPNWVNAAINFVLSSLKYWPQALVTLNPTPKVFMISQVSDLGFLRFMRAKEYQAQDQSSKNYREGITLSECCQLPL